MEKMAWLLRALSQGKYQTTFYNKSNSPFQSSVLGGIITLTGIAIAGTFMILILKDVFMKAHHNLDLDSIPLIAY